MVTCQKVKWNMLKTNLLITYNGLHHRQLLAVDQKIILTNHVECIPFAWKQRIHMVNIYK